MTKKKILIIDNCPTVSEMAKDALNISGYEVHTATSQIVANQHILSVDKKHDLILIEIIMPMLAGNKKVPKQLELSKDIPILFISNKPDNELKGLVADTGDEGYICKPFTKYDLLGAVKKQLPVVSYNG